MLASGVRVWAGAKVGGGKSERINRGGAAAATPFCGAVGRTRSGTEHSAISFFSQEYGVLGTFNYTGQMIEKTYTFRPVERCEMCGSARHRLLGMRLNASQGLRPRAAEGIAVSVKQCADCDLIFSDPQPIPASLFDHYGIPPDEYWSADDFSWSPEYFAPQIAIVKRLLPFNVGMTALDIGIGLGNAMQSLAHSGFEAFGIEPSRPFYERAIKQVDAAHVQHAAVEDADFPDESFDLITFGAVLEHVYRPSYALNRVFKWLKPGGIVHAEVPSSSHLLAKLVNLFFRLRGTNYVTHISPMHSPFHLYEFGLRSFERYAASSGFELAEHHYQVCSIYHVPRVLHRPFRWWMKRTKTGMQLTVYMRKPANVLSG